MSFLEILNSIFLDPIKIILETLFYFQNYICNDVIFIIGIMALLFNLLWLPVSNHINKLKNKISNDNFNTKCTKLYKKITPTQNYKVTLNYLAFNLFKMLFFIAVFDFFSELTILNEFYSGRLTHPDAIISFGNFSINVLPIFMVALNITYIVLNYKDASLKSKIELYSTTLLIFFILYNAPCGLVLFWTTTNAFYLLKYFLTKYKVLKSISKYVFSATGGIFVISYFFTKFLILIPIGILLQIPVLTYLSKQIIKKLNHKPKKKIKYRKNKIQFIVTTLLITLFVGVFIPSTYVSASPLEYINTSLFFNPLQYVFKSFLIAFGFFMVWLHVLYNALNKKGKYFLGKVFFILAIIMIVDYMFFGLELGVITSSLKYDDGFSFKTLELIINTLVILAIIIIFSFTFTKFKQYVAAILSLVIIIFSTMSTLNIVKSASAINDYKRNPTTNSTLSYDLSKTGHNVVVIMLDRAMSSFIPFIMNENPTLAEQFEGFTFYQNTISFGFYTNFGVPALLGGYEYTPVELNKRDDKPLKDKHNEAHLVLPKLFAEQNYNVSLVDPVYINYKWSSDLTIFEEYEKINAFFAYGKFVDDYQIQSSYDKNMSNFFRFSFMKSMPLLLQSILYDGGNYNHIRSNTDLQKYGNQTTSGISKGTGISAAFMNNYLTMKNMDAMSNVTSDDTNTFLFFKSDITHEPMLLDEANGYIPNHIIDNSEFDKNNSNRFTLSDGRKLNINNSNQMIHYHSNMAALMHLGNWFDFLRKYDIYNNTRIIITSDHGRDLNCVDSLLFEDYDLEKCSALLMVKDFGETSPLKTSNEFMTNADVATLATQNLGFDAVNPFSGKTINMQEKHAHPQYIITSSVWDVNVNNGNTFKPSKWLEFDSTMENCNIYNLENWKSLNEDVVLKNHSFN